MCYSITKSQEFFIEFLFSSDFHAFNDSCSLNDHELHINYVLMVASYHDQRVSLVIYGSVRRQVLHGKQAIYLLEVNHFVEFLLITGWLFSCSQIFWVVFRMSLNHCHIFQILSLPTKNSTTISRASCFRFQLFYFFFKFNSGETLNAHCWTFNDQRTQILKLFILILLMNIIYW